MNTTQGYDMTKEQQRTLLDEAIKKAFDVRDSNISEENYKKIQEAISILADVDRAIKNQK